MEAGPEIKKSSNTDILKSAGMGIGMMAIGSATVLAGVNIYESQFGTESTAEFIFGTHLVVAGATLEVGRRLIRLKKAKAEEQPAQTQE